MIPHCRTFAGNLVYNTVSARTYCKGRYEVRDVLGRGRWSSVHLCYDRSARDAVDELVAVKVIDVASAEPGIAREMFRREVGALDGFQHKHMVRLVRHHDDADDGKLFLVFDAIDGGRTLANLLELPAVQHPMHWRVQQAIGILDALDHAHRRGIVHRDIKPGNLLFDRRENQLLLADFGIARVVEQYARGESQATLRDFFTLPYAAPEQRMRDESNYPADLYAFGWVLAALFTWRIPAESDSPADLPAKLLAAFADLEEPGLAHEVSEHVALLHNRDAEKRPNIALCRRILDRLLAACTPRPVVRVTFMPSVRAKAEAAGWRPYWKTLTDINEGLRVIEVPSKFDDGMCIRCYGTRTDMLLKPEPGELRVIDWSESAQADRHAKSREHATPVPFVLQDGRGDPSEFVQFVHDARAEATVRKRDRQDRQKFVDLNKYILGRQRDRLSKVHMRVRRASASTPSTAAFASGDPFKEKLLALGAKATPVVQSEAKEYEHFEVLLAWTGDRDSEPGEDAEPLPSWCWDVLEGSAADFDVFNDAKSLGHLHAADRAGTITVRFGGKRHVPQETIITFRESKAETAIQRQEQAIDAFLDEAAVHPRLAELLLEPTGNTLDAHPPVEAIQPKLASDDDVLEMVRKALAARDFFLVQGPPGAGKTTFITEVIAQILAVDSTARILLTSQSNEAVDNATDGLRRVAGNLGRKWRIVRDRRAPDDDAAPKVGFPYDYAKWAEETIARCAATWAELEPSLVGHDTSEIDSALKVWRDKLKQRSDAKRDYAESVHVWAMTLLRVPTLWRLLGEGVQFDYVIVDEAARATTAEVLVALITGKRFVLVGDHKQLPPFFDDATKKDIRLSGNNEREACRSLFEVLFERMPEENKSALRRQFRMHPSIGRLVGKMFYPELHLQHGVKHEDRPLLLEGLNGEERIFWLDVHGAEQKAKNSKSISNPIEADAIAALLRQWESQLADRKLNPDGVGYSVGVIAAYRDQVPKLKEKIRPDDKRWKHLSIVAATVDAFQGKERDIVIWSMVRVEAASLEFISDEHRLDVAISRAKSLLLIAGHMETARQSSLLSQVVDAVSEDRILVVKQGA